jgi:hypothetical protein
LSEVERVGVTRGVVEVVERRAVVGGKVGEGEGEIEWDEIKVLDAEETEFGEPLFSS